MSPPKDPDADRGSVGWTAYALLVLAAGLITYLAYQNHQLSREYLSAREALALPKVGYTVPAFDSKTLSGRKVTVGTPAGVGQLLLVFEVHCPYCRKTLPAWKEIETELARLKESGIEILGLSLNSRDSTRQYVTENELSFDVTTFPNARLVRLYKATSYPLTILVDSTGRVEYSRLGVISNRATIDSVLAAVGSLTDDSDHTAIDEQLQSVFNSLPRVPDGASAPSLPTP